MTKRPRSSRAPNRSGLPPPLGREDFPAVRAFVRGYLHEDFQAVHGSLGAAASAFIADASPSERDQLVRELETLARLLATRPARVLQQFLTDDLGSRWAPRSHEELAELVLAIRPR